MSTKRKQAEAWLWPTRGVVVPIELVPTVPADELILLAYILKYYETDDWFICPMVKTQKMLGISKNQHSRLFGRLRRKGYVETKMVGIPGRRHVRVVFTKLLKDIAKAS